MSKFSQIDIAVKNAKSPINVITYSNTLNYVAVGRDDGTVEIYDFSQNCLLLAKIIISNKNLVEGLKFMNFKEDVKLFGISSNLFEIDLSKNYIKQEILFPSSNCSRSIVQAGDKIAVGCDGGYIHVYEYISEIKFTSTIHNAGESILSLAYSKLFSNFLFAGSQGRLYKINLSTNNADYFDLMKEKNKSHTFIWCLEFTGKFLCSGDSKGVITIWNPDTFGIIQNFSTHKADILTISTGPNCLYASGFDPRVVKLEYNGDIWIETTKRFGLVGDVRSLCCTENKLISGGMNCALAVFDIHANYSDRMDKYQQIDAVVPANEIHAFSDDLQILFTETNKSIQIYEVNTLSHTKNLLRTIKPPNESHLQAWSASKSLTYLAYSTNTETRILKMRFSEHGGNPLSVDLKRFNTAEFSNSIKAHGPGVSLPPSYLLKFVEMQGKTYLVLVESVATNIRSDNNSKLFIYEIVENSTKPTLITSILAKEENHFNGVHKLEASDNGKCIAFSTLDGFLFIYSLEKLRILKKLARQTNPNKKGIPRVTCMKFNQKATFLVVLYTNKRLWKIDVNGNLGSKWCNGFNANIRQEWANLNPLAVDFVDNDKVMVLMTRGLIVQLNMDKPPLVPLNVPLFTRSKIAKAVKQRTMRLEIAALEKNVAKMKRIIDLLTARNDIGALKNYEKRLANYQAKIQKLQSTDVDTNVETCFTWDFVKKDTVLMQYESERQRIISVSLEEAEQLCYTYRKKAFGA